MKTLLLALIGLVAAAIGFGKGGEVGNLVGAAATLVSALASIRQYRESLAIEIEFQRSSWTTSDGQRFSLEISSSRHGKGKSFAIAVYDGDVSRGFRLAVISPIIAADGGIKIEAATTFHGKLVIK